MNNNFTCQVFPHQPNLNPITLSKEERKSVKGLSGFATVPLWVILSYASFYLVIIEMFEIPLYQVEWSIYFIFLLVSAAVIAVTSYLIKNARVSRLERKRTNEAHQEEHQRVIREAENTTSHLRRTYDSSVECANKLSNCLDNAVGWLQTAEQEYKANAFAPYWDAIEHSAVWLGDYNQTTKQIAQNADEYYRSLSERSHTFPSFPVSPQNIPDPSFVVSELRRITRLGQTNFHFANIWEHRKTRKAIVAGFRTLNEAINDLGNTIEHSVSGLRESISSDLAQVVEEQIRTRESVDRTPELIEKTRETLDEKGVKIDKRLLEQNRMIDNIQHGREPKLRDIPSKR